MTKLTLRPLSTGQVYVSGEDETLRKLTVTYRLAPGLINQHVISAVFEPLNDTSLVLVVWAMGGINVTNRDTIKILNLETNEVEPAWA